MPKCMDEKTVSPFVAASHLEMASCSGTNSTTRELWIQVPILVKWSLLGRSQRRKCSATGGPGSDIAVSDDLSIAKPKGKSLLGNNLQGYSFVSWLKTPGSLKIFSSATSQVWQGQSFSMGMSLLPSGYRHTKAQHSRDGQKYLRHEMQAISEPNAIFTTLRNSALDWTNMAKQW